MLLRSTSVTALSAFILGILVTHLAYRLLNPVPATIEKESENRNVDTLQQRIKKLEQLVGIQETSLKKCDASTSVSQGINP
jgi:hypothetical protein